MGECTINIVHDYSDGDLRRVIAEIAGSDSYATGGDDCDLKALLNFRYVLHHMLESGSYDAEYSARFDDENDLLRIYTMPGIEVTAATDLSAVHWRIEVVGV
jgi:hypothetical protein